MSTSSPLDDAALHAALEKYFRYPAFRPGQHEALQHVLQERDTLVVMPTGSGKSLIYQLAALLRHGTALVISPLVALMKDQVDSLTQRGIAATYINSTLTVPEQNRRLDALASAQYKIVLVAPERLRNSQFRGALKRVPLSMLAIDEAHCVSQWGHDFRPDYLHLANARAEFKPPVTLALTATATLRVQDDIIKMLALSDAARLVTGFNRPNVYLEVLNAPDVKTKFALTREFLANPEIAQRGGIIYAGTRRDTEEVADFVREVCRINAAYYHAGMDNETRHAVQDKFLAGDIPVVVATNAFGMGIDRPDVRYVLHFTMPGTLEAYYQEAGRAGRDGLPARAVLIYSPRDTALHQSFIANDSPTENDLRALHQYLQTHPQTNAGQIEQHIGLREVTMRVALEQLENARLIARAPDEEFGTMRIQAAPLNDAVLRQIAAQVQVRQDHKRRLLAKMIAYAETNACRRRVILEYFGDTGNADVPLCCDNDVSRAQLKAQETNARAATTETEQIALTVLEAAQTFQRKMGKGKLGDILKGSRAKDVLPFEKSPHYGKLNALRRTDLDALIRQLFDGGYLKQVGGEYPTLLLTPRGEHALKTRAAIQTDIRPPTPGAAEKARAEKEAGGTVLLTGQMLAQGNTPQRIAEIRGLTLGTIYSHLAQLIAQGQADVNRVVPQPLQNQIRVAIHQAGSAQYLAPIKALLPEDVDYNVIRCVANAWLREQREPPIQPSNQPPSNAVDDFLSRPHPRALPGPWRAGWALDFHSRFDGDTQNRGIIGDLAFRYKYRGEKELAAELAARWAELLRQHSELPKFDTVLAIPSTTPREFDPVSTLAYALSREINVPALLGVLQKTRVTKPQKEITALAQKQANVRGAFVVRGDVRGKHILLIDDLFDSGATLQEAARTLQRAGSIDIVVLTLTKTIHTDR